MPAPAHTHQPSGCDADCRHEFAAVLPILVAVPSQSLPFWEAEWAFWAQNTNVVPYAGTLASRTILMEHELYLNASSLDGKLTGKLKDEMPPEVSSFARVFI